MRAACFCSEIFVADIKVYGGGGCTQFDFSEMKIKPFHRLAANINKTCECHFIKNENFHFQTKMGVILNIFECVG